MGHLMEGEEPAFSFDFDIEDVSSVDFSSLFAIARFYGSDTKYRISIL